VSWKKKWIRMVAWCLELDGRRDRDECAKPIVGCGTGPAVDPVAVFSLVRFQEKEMRKALQVIIRLVESWVDSDEKKAEATMLKILNTALEVV
jgi:hypothetical protein